jgi:formylglycine-generating enzyme required for sulfatase activity
MTGLSQAANATAGATEGQQPSAATNAALVMVAFDLQRLSDRDLLLRHDGERLTGALRNETLSLRTPYAALTFPAARLAGVELGGPARELDVVLTVNQNRFSGFLEDPHLVCQLAPGEQRTVRREEASRVIFRRRDNELEGLPRGQFILLRNGDFFTGAVLGGPFKLITANGEVTVDLAAADAIQFLEGPRRLTRVVMRQGAAVEGTWPGEDLEIKLDLGPRLRVHQSRVASIACRRGPVAPALAGPEGRDGTDATATPHSTQPPGGRSLPGLTWIVPGQFAMGSPPEEAGRDLDEGPQTKVTITRGFWMGTREVTQEEYRTVQGANPSTFVGDPQRPVERVTWREAMDYCDRLTRLQAEAGALPAGYAYRLPTEAEWEYACRAGATSRFSFGDDPDSRRLGDYAWFGDNSESTTHPVGTKQPNPWGLSDMHGNVLEWCLDAATSSLPGGSVTDYRAPAGGSLRIARGGSWLYGAKSCRSANRDNYGENSRCIDLGFRVVLAPTGH